MPEELDVDDWLPVDVALGDPLELDVALWLLVRAEDRVPDGEGVADIDADDVWLAVEESDADRV